MKRSKKIRIVSLIFLILFSVYFQSIVYAAINSSLTMTGDAVARIKSNVRINSFKIYEVSNGVVSSYEDFSKAYTMSNVTLPYSDSYIIYELVIGNYEDVEMQLSNITGIPANLTYELIDYNFHDMICDNTGKCFGGVEKTFYLKIKYANYNASAINYNINLDYEFKEFSNKIMIGTAFRDTIPSNATHLEFTDDKPADGILLTDVSFEQDMGVVGYLDGTTYKISTRRTGEMPEANADSSYMFNGKSLINIDLDNLDISKTTNIIGMFDGCTSLLNINFDDEWDTSNITDMKYLFRNCSSLSTIDLSGFNTSKVKSFSEFFNGCSSLTRLDVSQLDTSSSTSLKSMFKNCCLLEVIDVSGFVTSKITNFADMFSECSSVLVLDVSRFNTSAATSLSGMFYNVNKVKILDVSNWNVSNVENISYIFYNCESLLSVDTKNWNTRKVKSLFAIFTKCTSLTELDLSNWDVSNVTTGYWMMEGCSSLVSLNMSGWKFKNNITINGMFHGLASLKFVDLSDWDTSMVTGMDHLFTNCFEIEYLDLSSWDTSLVANMGSMFAHCKKLKRIYVGEYWSTDSVIDSENMFTNCGNLTNYNSNYLDAAKAYVGDGGYLTKINKFYIDDVSYMCDDNMTWEAWVSSEYNVDNFKSVMGAFYYLSKNGENPGYFIKNSNGDLVNYYGSTINVNEKYTLGYEQVSHNGGSAD